MQNKQNHLVLFFKFSFLNSHQLSLLRSTKNNPKKEERDEHPFFSIPRSKFHWPQFSRSVLSDSLRLHGLQYARIPCRSPTPRAYSNSCPLSLWCHRTISSSVIPFSSCLQSFPASGSFPMSQFFASGGQSTEASASASVLPMNIQDWFPLGLTAWISLQSKGLSRVFSNTTFGDKFVFSNTKVGYKFIKICKPLLNWSRGGVKYKLTNL